MDNGIGAPEKGAPTLESLPLLNIHFSFASVYLLSWLTSPSTNVILREKITFKVVISGQEFLTGCNEFWGARGVSNLQWSELLAFWRSEALLPSTGLKVSGSKHELVARVFEALEMEIPFQPLLHCQIWKMDLLCQILLTLKHWLCESDAITSWPPIFLSDITVFLMEDHPRKDVALHERVLNEYNIRQGIPSLWIRLA